MKLLLLIPSLLLSLVSLSIQESDRSCLNLKTFEKFDHCELLPDGALCYNSIVLNKWWIFQPKDEMERECPDLLYPPSSTTQSSTLPQATTRRPRQTRPTATTRRPRQTRPTATTRRPRQTRPTATTRRPRQTPVQRIQRQRPTREPRTPRPLRRTTTTTTRRPTTTTTKIPPMLVPWLDSFCKEHPEWAEWCNATNDLLMLMSKSR